MPRGGFLEVVSDPTFATRIVAWQRNHGRHDLPWQNTRDAYRIWLSEVMLQQTQVAAVLPYYARFVASFPDVRALAAASLDSVLAHWSGLGYYRRAHHLHQAAKVVVEKHGGVFPRDAATLAQLPGIGRSTAAAIAAFASGERGAILDGNVKRVLARHRGIAGAERDLWAMADVLLPGTDIEAYTQGLMDLGAIVCTRTPRCGECPVATDCIARREDRIGELPSPRPARTLPQRAVRVLVLEHCGEILLERRPPNGVWSGLWSLPELALEGDVVAGVRDRFGVTADACVPLPPFTHGFTHFTLTLHPQRVAVSQWPMQAQAPGQVWLSPNDALASALPAPIRRLIASLSSTAAVPSAPNRATRPAAVHRHRDGRYETR
jgi:A/G-specific adenine glycosylase